jgi:rhamnogalacturonan endolyase
MPVGHRRHPMASADLLVVKGEHMDRPSVEVSRRAVLGVAGTAAAAATLGSILPTSARAATAADDSNRDDAVAVLINGQPAAVGSYAFPAAVDTLVLDNGLIRFTFGRDDAAGGIVTGWTDTSITATSVIVNGTELAHDLNGVNPRDPDRQHSFYVDAGGGKTRLVCSRVDVLRASKDLVEVAFVDTTGTPMQHTHHLVMRRGKQGIYGFVVMTIVADTSTNEIRMNARWNRGIFDHAYNWERGSGIQPTYAYLDTQLKVGDETWQIDGKNDPNLPFPDSNGGNLPAGYTYTKYNWSLYHHENPMFGHYGNGFGAWFTSLGGVTDQTLCASYASGPQHQDLAIHQDALILNYFAPNHYGQTPHAVTAGYTRLFGPWFTFITAGDENHPENAIAQGKAIAAAEIKENFDGAAWMDHPLYPSVQQRTTVTGRVRLADGRPADGLWVLLSTEDNDTIFTIKEATYFVRTDADGNFELPGIPPAWAPGTATPSTYNLYVFSSKGSATQVHKQTGVNIHGERQNLGTITWAVDGPTTFLWQLGKADRTSGEFALATKPATHATPRAFEKPGQVPDTVNFTIGSSWEPRDWYYAQTKAGTWTVNFELDRTYTGTAVLTVSTSMQNGGSPTVAVNGVSTGITGTVPSGNDSTIARQADRSGFPRLAALTFPAAMLRTGPNTITFTRGASGSGIGWDTVVLEVDEATAPQPARLDAQLASISGPTSASKWTVTVTNQGPGTAYDVRLSAAQFSGRAASHDGTTPTVVGADPNEFPLPIVDVMRPGDHTSIDVTFDLRGSRVHDWIDLDLTISANGGRTVSSTSRGHRPNVVQLR